MPTIKLQKKKQREVTVNKAAYQAIYNTPRWKRLRAEKVMNNPLCEKCLDKKPPVIKQTEEVHHKKPFEIARSQDEIEALAFDYDNLISLCIECHKEEHVKLRI
jgi:5-methylcytosine-specific restriction enzyme A